MRTWIHDPRKSLFAPRPSRQPRQCRLRLERLDDRCLPSANVGFVQTNLVSDLAGVAAVQDPNLVNPWGLASSATSPFWVSDNGAGVSTLYNGNGQPVHIGTNGFVTVPPPDTMPPTPQSAPTGVVFNGSSDFVVSLGGKSGPARFIFVTEDGTVSGWSPAVDVNNAILEVNNTNQDTGPVFKGATLGQIGTANVIYVTDFRDAKIDVFDSHFAPVTLSSNAFSDSNLPAGYAPFNIQNINGKLYVTYAKQDAAKHDDVAGQGNGFVDVFNPDGSAGLANGQVRLISRGQLDSPWGLAVAPADFGKFSNDLLVGNFGNGHINAFDPATGHAAGEVKGANGRPIVIDGLWALRFGNGAGAGSTDALFFTAGIDGESHGLFGSLIAKGAPVVTNLSSAAFQSVSTMPANGDQNPYGVAVVPKGFEGHGVLKAGDTLVSNFNDATNTQGTGSTIVRITPDGQQSVFFQGSPGLGLTTALGVLKGGFVVVGSVPNAGGSIGAGSLLILDANGHMVSQLSDSKLLDGPWDLTINDRDDHAQVFVSNILSGTVTRIDLRVPDRAGRVPVVIGMTQIGSGYAHRPDANALLVGPTGLAFDRKTDTLYVAATADNEIFAIRDASDTRQDRGTGKLVVQDPTHLHGPLGLVLAPNGDLIVSNGDAVNPDPKQQNEIVEFTKQGAFVGQFQLDTGQAGA
ncbi:MAG TPA: TIGR03118 family protein, partial [Gemmataceae bacterium]|nr:TIGR03118 family protein [Gemmataceae bacterium]